MCGGSYVSFENIHKMHSKCTPKQIMLYQISLNLHKVLNPLNEINFELVTVLEQTVCGGRQLRFEILRNFRGKIGMNTTANKFYHITNLISLDMLNLSYIHFKKIAKIQFLKYGKTWFPIPMCAKFVWVLCYLINKLCVRWLNFYSTAVSIQDNKWHSMRLPYSLGCAVSIESPKVGWLLYQESYELDVKCTWISEYRALISNANRTGNR